MIALNTTQWTYHLTATTETDQLQVIIATRASAYCLPPHTTFSKGGHCQALPGGLVHLRSASVVAMTVLSLTTTFSCLLGRSLRQRIHYNLSVTKPRRNHSARPAEEHLRMDSASGDPQLCEHAEALDGCNCTDESDLHRAAHCW